MRIRAAIAEDAGFLLDMLVEAYNWSGEEWITRVGVEAEPELGRYIEGWPRPDDFGVIAVDDDAPVGAAWARSFSSAAPGYGYVAADVPELSMGVVAAERGRGIGTRLLRAIIEAARGRGVRALSLSVEDGNPAARMYRAAGFATVARKGNSDTMLLELRAAAPQPPPT